MAQDFHLARFTEYRAQGMSAYRRGAWKDARFGLLKAAEHLLKLARESDGPLREQRLENAKKLSTMAKSIDVDAPLPRTGAASAAGGASHPAGAPGAKEGESDAAERRFQPADRPTVRFSDIAGLEDVKEQVRLRMIYPLRHPEKAQRYGIRSGGGVLLYGPPGTGKTLVARAIAGELEAAFYTVKPSELLSKWVGESEQNIAGLFREARANPLSVVFIDEVEALVPARRDAQAGIMARVVPQILAELEGFDTAGKRPILFLGATNEPWALDPAVLRPGRFDEKIYVGLPDLPARRAMLDMHLRGRPVAPDVDLNGLSIRLEGYSGADIRNVCDRAAGEAFLAAIEAASGGPANATATGSTAPGGVPNDAGPALDAGLFDRILAAVRPSVKPETVARFLQYAESV